MKNKVYLSLGSNIGNRQEYIESAIELVGKTEGNYEIGRASCRERV